MATKRQIPVFQRRYSELTYEREGRNGRIYRGILGWRWYPYLSGSPVGDPSGYRTRAEAKREAFRLLESM